MGKSLVSRSSRTRSGLLGLMALIAAALSSCAGDGHFTVLGYTTRPNYDTSIRTVYVPIFKNLTLRRGLEFDITRAVVREIEAKTPYKVVSCPDGADTELTGTVISLNKSLINFTPLNEVREGQVTLGVEMYWRDLRTGEVLSLPKIGKPGDPPLPPVPPLPGAAPPPPVLVQAIGGYFTELGGSLTTAEKQVVDRLAVQIVSMMEIPW